jgi:DNA helicase-2/ATP-dependent DNA helicase PcrA
VLATEGAVLILAGAGSGKTRVITHRIAHLVLDKGVPSERILAVTFTNKAAGEMKARTEALLPGQAVKSWISTFHSLCVRILRREAAAAGLPKDFVIYDDEDQLQAVRGALRALDLPEKVHPPRRILARISAAKNAGRDVQAAGGPGGTEGSPPLDERARIHSARAGGPGGTEGSPPLDERARIHSARADDDSDSVATATLARVAERYRQTLESAHALDFDDLLLRSVALLESNEGVRESYRQRFQYVLVDEYQDTNRSQYELVRHLAGRSGNITVVGDEDQSIYSWRGADIRNILDFEADFPGARVLRLEENYRSRPAILHAAGGLVAHNEKRKGKTLRAVKTAGEPVRLHQAGDEYQEAAWVVSRISGTREGGRAAVLYRMNSQSRLFEEALMRAGVPYEVWGGVGFYERREVKDLLAYLRLIANPRDPIALRRVVNVPPRGIGDRTVQELERVARERALSPWDALGVVEGEGLLPARATLPLRRFREMLQALRLEAPSLGLKNLLTRVLEVTGYAAALAQEESHESQDRLENLAELLSAAADYESREESPSLTGFLDRVSLLSDVDKARDDAPVVLMTLHSAKGLEFDSIFLVGLEEGLVPHARSLARGDALEEERRLCYVGMTRARERLHLTWAQSRSVFGQRRLSEPSRFLVEIPRDQVEATADGRVPVMDYSAPRRRYGADRSFTPAPGPAQGGPSTTELRPGARVRHPLFGVGTVLRSETAGEDLKVTVSFPGVGAKKLVARYAGLELV